MTEKSNTMNDDNLIAAPMIESFELIDQLAKKLYDIRRLTVSEVDLTPTQFRLMRLLWEKDGQPFKDLADSIDCSRPTVTGIVDTLERKALVARQPNLKDRRSLLVTLTPKGKALEEGAPDLERIYAKCSVALSPDEFRQLTALLDILEKSLDCS